jgi:hypothetical protein
LLRVVRLHHAFFPHPLKGRKRKRKKMKESNNTDTSGKVQYPPLGVGGKISTHYQQLPIKVKLLRLQVQPLIEEGIAHNLYGAVHAFQHRLALLRH